MRYMFLIYSRETDLEGLTAADRETIMNRHWTVMDEARERGVFHGAEPLQPTTAATTVRPADGQPLVTDGPFAETKEQLAGYYILDCRDLDEAIEWAAKTPTDCRGGSGCIEIRPLVGLPPR